MWGMLRGHRSSGVGGSSGCTEPLACGEKQQWRVDGAGLPVLSAWEQLFLCGCFLGPTSWGTDGGTLSFNFKDPPSLVKGALPKVLWIFLSGRDPADDRAI